MRHYFKHRGAPTVPMCGASLGPADVLVRILDSTPALVAADSCVACVVSWANSLSRGPSAVDLLADLVRP